MRYCLRLTLEPPSSKAQLLYLFNSTLTNARLDFLTNSQGEHHRPSLKTQQFKKHYRNLDLAI